jgi:hypothetical protein
MAKYCGARSKREYGKRCRLPPMRNGRCRLHGGKLTGGYRGQPIWQANKALHAKQVLWRELGLSWYGGRPRKRSAVAAMAEEAKVHLVGQIEAIEKRLPVDVRDRPIGELSHAEALGRAALSGLHRLVEIVEMPLWDPDPGDLHQATVALKQIRLVGDMARASGGLYMQAAEAEFQGRKMDRIAEILARLDDAQANPPEAEVEDEDNKKPPEGG